jgi:Cd2+/Zn2+-exporting ATPase/Cu+-exporting ATPase
MSDQKSIEVPVRGMDCAECAAHVQKAISGVEGVENADVLLGAEKAIIRFNVDTLDLDRVRAAVADAGYEVPHDGAAGGPRSRGGTDAAPGSAAGRAAGLTRRVLTLFGIAVGAILFIVVVGEWLGLFDAVVDRVPWYIALAVVLAGGYPIFRNVIQATLRGRVLAHTLMTVGAVAAMVAGEWVTAAVVVFFMRLGDFAERFTADSARGALRGLEDMAPQQARVERDGAESMVEVAEVSPGDIVVVRPGERIPVDGTVVSGSATIDQSAITGESMPVDAVAGSSVFAATIPQLGALRIRAERIGRDSTFGTVIRMVESAEANKGYVQRVADRFSGYYLPVVAVVAGATFIISGDALATVAVLVVACSCAFALATPIAVLASVGAAAKRGLLIKGGRYLETLDKADVLLVDKTGTLTLGETAVREIVPAAGFEAQQVLRLAASAERYSEHPIADGVRRAAADRGLDLAPSEEFEAVPGAGVRARVDGAMVEVTRSGSQGERPARVVELAADGATIIDVRLDGGTCGYIAVGDRIRPEVPAAMAAVRELGIDHVELLTGDAEATAAGLAASLGVAYRAELMPEDKIRIVREYQAQGRTVVMVGDGVNDAPALAQADVGIAMGAAGSDVAVESADAALLRDDWMLVPEALRVAHRTLRVIRGNIGFTAVYNLAGLTLAAVGILPPVLAAAAQSLPDLGIMANSSRLLRQGRR